MTTGNDKSHSSIITHRLPEFVQTDNPTLSAFVRAYYEWLEQQKDDGYLRTPMALGANNDIDEDLNLFVSEFKKQYLLDFPEQLAVNEDGNTVDVKQLIKNIKEFYRNKGTEKTYEFLFRILYDTAVEFYYPSRDILRLSDGKWIQKKSIRCSNGLGSRIFEARGKVVRQKSNDGSVVASGRVIDVVTYQLGSREVAELFLTNINGQFKSNTIAATNYEGIEFEGNDGTVLSESKIYPVLSSISVTSTGSNYRKGERIFFQPNISPYRQNLLKYSQQFDNSIWAKSNNNPILRPNATFAPDLSNTAYRFEPSTVGDGNPGNAGNHQINQTFAAKQNKWYTVSIYAKADEYYGGVIRFQPTSTANCQTYYQVNPSDPKFTTAIETNGSINTYFDTASLSRSITSVGNGWYRITLTGKWIAADASDVKAVYFFGRSGASKEGSPQTSTTTYGLFIWGSQVNEYDSDPGSSPATPYLRTEATVPLVVQPTNDTGQGAIATITEVNPSGGIVKTRIDNFGAGYEISPLYSINTAFGSGATISTSTGTVCTYPGYYSGNDGRLSTNKVIQDNHYYQNFSYVLLSEVVIDRYKEILRRLIHPAGMGMFGKVSVNRCLEDAPETDALLKKTDTELIGSYTPYTLDTHVDIGNLLFNGRATPYFPSLHDSVITGASGNPTDLQLYSVGQNFATWSNDATKWDGMNNNHFQYAGQDIAPNGKNEAVLIRKTSTTSSTLARLITWNSSSTSATYSVYIKQPTTNARRYASITFRNQSITTNLISVLFDFQTQKFVSNDSTTFTNEYGNASIESVGNGWYRIKITITNSISRGNSILLYYGNTGSSSGTLGYWQPDEGLLVWGMQFEEGTTAKTLVKTEASPIIHRSYAIGFDPRNISGLRIWLDGKTLTAAGATVSAWSDSSGNGYTATSYSRTLLPIISSMGGVQLTGSSSTFGSVLTTANLNLNARTMFAAFTPFPLPSNDITTSQRNSLVVGLMSGQGTGGSTGAATGQYYQDHTVCVDYARSFVDGETVSPRIAAYYGVGNKAGPSSLWVSSLTGTDINTTSNEISTNRFALISNDSTELHSSFENELVGITAANPNTSVICSILSTDSRSLTSFAGGTATEKIYADKKSNNDFSTDARYYRYQLMGEHTIRDSGSYQFIMDMKTDIPNLAWRAVLTKNDGLPLPPTGRSTNDVPSYIASWNYASMSDGYIANAWSPSQYQTHKVSIKDLQKDDVIRVWMTPSLTAGTKPTNSSLNTSSSLYFKNFFAHQIYSDGTNLLTVNGENKGFAVGHLDGLTANQRLTIGFGQNYFNGVVHEVLVYDRVLTKQEREITEAYLHHRWKNNIIRAENHPWNLPIASLTAGVYPALPTEGGYTANANLSSSKGYPFYEISSHPNIFLSQKEEPYPARILRSQMNDFLGQGGTGTDGYWEEWSEQSETNRQNWAMGLSAAGERGSRHALLQYTTDSAFRKITAEAFLDRQVGRQFDCKNELVVEPSPPKVSLTYCNSFDLNEIVYTNGTIVFNYSIVNEENMEYWIADLLEVELSDGSKFYRYRPESSNWSGKFSISGFTSDGSEPKPYTVTFRLKNYYGKTIENSEASVSFIHKFVDISAPFDTINSCT
jgi:hypothetical protein